MNAFFTWLTTLVSGIAVCIIFFLYPIHFIGENFDFIPAILVGGVFFALEVYAMYRLLAIPAVMNFINNHSL